MMADTFQALTRAVVKVGDGRGFIVAHEHGPLVITAAHCLPHIPSPHPARYLDEYTYVDLLGALDEELKVWAECLFADVMADLAVLGEPDSQEFWAEYEAYEVFTEDRPALAIGDIPRSDLADLRELLDPIDTPVWMLQLDGRWTRTLAHHFGGPVLLSDDTAISGGMSGSPIMTEDGKAVGAISTGRMSPRLLHDLPVWLCMGDRTDIGSA
jgi:hypothetical protein